MSQAATAACDQARVLDAFAPTRANYERFAFLLLRVGHVPGLSLAHLDFRVLLFLLAQRPGHYAAHHHTIANACDSNTTSIRQALARLRAAGLVRWELIPPHHALPTGRFTRTNVNRYWVHLPRLETLLEYQSPLPKSGASTLPKSDASYGTEIKFETPFPPSPLRRRAHPKPVAPEVEEADGSKQVSEELRPIRESWRKLELGEFDSRSERALENRLAEGATLEQLEAAVAGASADEWLRRRAKVPFAVVFASVPSVQRFAHEGRKLLDRQAAKAHSQPEQGQGEKAADDHPNFAILGDVTPPHAEELRRLLPELGQTAGGVTIGDLDAGRLPAVAGASPAKSAAAPTIAKAARSIRRASEPNPIVTHPQQPPKRCSAPPPELARLLMSISDSTRLGRVERDQEAPKDRRWREQAEFDRNRLALVAALQSLEK